MRSPDFCGFSISLHTLQMLGVLLLKHVKKKENVHNKFSHYKLKASLTCLKNQMAHWSLGRKHSQVSETATEFLFHKTKSATSEMLPLCGSREIPPKLFLLLATMKKLKKKSFFYVTAAKTTVMVKLHDKHHCGTMLAIN